ncbi:hypothetical protein [Brevibacillus borstelensis]|uniref:hypothetical protein n=1 Tax=Brevibacillus borstelensis TaxID=45462 RepID=UPI0030FCAFC4
MKGQVYIIQGMRWEVTRTFWRRKVEWARMKCLDKRRRHRSVTIEFLKLIEHRRRVS